MTAGLARGADYFTAHLRRLALEIRAAVGSGVHGSTHDELARPTDERGGDRIYRLDEHGEGALLAHCERWSEDLPFLLVAEGLEGGEQRFARRPDESLAFTLIVDPIDGTRGLMYGKRSAWALLAVAPPQSGERRPTLAEVAVAVQAELPTSRAALADVLWAARGEGVQAETHDLRTGEIRPFIPRPSQASSLADGFATVCKFFPGSKAAAVELEEALFRELLGPPVSTSPQVFDDEYISSGGQLYELMVGHDRFIADLRPVLHAFQDEVPSMTCHPYDLCTWLIAQEAGVIVTDAWGDVPSAPLDTITPVDWVGYANESLKSAIEPILQRLLRERVGRP